MGLPRLSVSVGSFGQFRTIAATGRVGCSLYRTQTAPGPHHGRGSADGGQELTGSASRAASARKPGPSRRGCDRRRRVLGECIGWEPAKGPPVAERVMQERVIQRPTQNTDKRSMFLIGAAFVFCWASGF